MTLRVSTLIRSRNYLTHSSKEVFRYFDTPYTYHGYNAEKAVRKALTERHPREDFELATKLPLRDFKDEADMERIFNEQLENCGVEYFDYYLLHNMGCNVYERCEKYKAFDFVARMSGNSAIPCTGCEYCIHGCPKNIAIPQYFSAYNSIMRTSGSFSSQSVYYNNLVLAGHGKASDCIKCGKCETACPQHLPIREYLETVADKMEHTSILPVRKA